MSFASFLNANKILDVSTMDSSSQVAQSLTIQSGSTSITHSIDGSGNYQVVDGNNNKLIAFDTNNNLLSSGLSNALSNQVSPVSRTVTAQTTQITALQTLTSQQAGLINGLLAGSPVNTVVTGTIAGTTTSTLTAYAVASNTIGVLQGVLISDHSTINFNVYTQNVSGTVSIISWSTNGFFYSNDSLSFSVSGTNIHITFTNSNSSSTPYTLNYLPTFQSR
jgi:hypothetical protein